MLTIVYSVVFRQVLCHIILDNSLHYFAHYACQTNRSVVAWLTPISLLVNRDNVRASLQSCGMSPDIIYFLIISANTSPISSLSSFIIFGCIASIPGLLSVRSFSNSFITLSLVNVTSLNLCSSPPLNIVAATGTSPPFPFRRPTQNTYLLPRLPLHL